MKIFQLIDLIIRLFKLNKRSKVVLLFLVPTFLLGQNNGAFWLGKRTTGGAPTNLLLDDYPGAAAAYSVRKLDKDYTGFAMEIRRASDNATQKIGFVGEDLDVTSINTFCSGTTCTVRTWYDQSGNSRNATQTTSTSQPIIYQSNATLLSNSKPAVFFNADILQLPNSLIVTSPSTIITVYDWESANAGAALINYRSNPLDDPELRYGPSAGSVAFYWNGQYFVNPLSTTTTQTLVALSFTGSTTATMYVDGSSSRSDFKTGPLSTGSPVVPFTFGYYSLVNNYANGYIQEFILYNSDVLFNNAEIRTNINSYYSIY